MLHDPHSLHENEAGGRLTIDLNAFAANWRLLRDRSGTQAAAVVKADAYGLGIEQAVPALLKAGCTTFFVAHLSEGKRVRAIAPDATIYILNGFNPGTGLSYIGNGLRPVLGSQQEIDEWAAFSRSQSKRLPAALHVDTGMNRLGLSITEGLALKGDARLNDFEPALLMSHLVSAEEPDNPINARQIAHFQALRDALPHVPASLANCSGIFLKNMPRFDLVRPGYALYGGNPTPGQSNPMREVVRLEGLIIQVREVQDGESVGYNGVWTARGKRRLATVSIGYADGYPRLAGNTDASAGQGGIALVAGRPCPFAGRVSMDLIILDVTEVAEHLVSRGDYATFIGDGLTVDEVGRRAQTIGYEILTSLGHRYARRYRGDGA